MLAVLAPRYGAVSETFIKRHITALAPGRTLPIVRNRVGESWGAPPPALVLRETTNFLGSPARLAGLWQLDLPSRRLHSFLKSSGATVLLAEWLDFACWWQPAFDGLGLRTYAFGHGIDCSERALGRRRNKGLYQRLRRFDGLIAPSQFHASRFTAAGLSEPRKIHVISLGVDLPTEVPDRRERSSAPLCLTVGRFVAKKEPLSTLRAFSLAHSACPGLRLELIGEGPLLPECQEFCRTHDLCEEVTFHGLQSPAFVAKRLAAADIFLQHSVVSAGGDEEGQPLSIKEAMAWNLPVISTNHGGIPEEIAEGTTGFLVEEHDWRAMGERLVELVEQPELRWRLGAAGRVKVETEFSAEQEIRKLRALLLGSL